MAAGGPESRLLAEAIADPFVRLGEVVPTLNAGRTFAIEDWYRLAREKAPLWCFNKWAFQTLRDDGLPSSYPLSRIIARIAQDEHVDLVRMQRVMRPKASKAVPLPDLERHLYTRRASLAEGKNDSAWLERSDDGAWIAQNGADRFRGASEVDRGPFSGDSSLWDLGGLVMAHLEALEAAGTKYGRAVARRELDAFLDNLGRKLAWGRPTKGPPVQVLEPLFEQGTWLFNVCWDALRVAAPCEDTHATFDAFGLPRREHALWAVRLALPMLSVAEIRALRRKASEARGRHPHVAPRRFAVFVLAHRFGEEPVTLAGRLRPKEDARAFFAKPENSTPIRGSRLPL